MTLNDLERRNSPYFAFFLPNSIALQANYVTVVKDRHTMSVKYSIHFWPKLTHPAGDLSAIVEHLVHIQPPFRHAQNSDQRH